MREAEEEAWFSFLRPEEREAIFGIYLSKPSLKMRGNEAKDLFRKLKQVEREAKDTEADLLSTFKREAGQLAHQLKELQERAAKEFQEKFKVKLGRPSEFEELRKICIGLKEEKKRSQERLNQLQEENRGLKAENEVVN
jgi:hypothetical protein